MAKVFITILGVIFSAFFFSATFCATTPGIPTETTRLSSHFETAPHVILVGQVASLASSTSATLLVQPLHGTVAMDDNGSFSYRPQEGFEGQDFFIYEICNEAGDCEQAVTYVDVLPSDLAFGELATSQNFQTCEMADGSVQLLSTEAAQDGQDTYHIYHRDAMGHIESTLVGLSHKTALPKASQLILQVSAE